MNAAEHYTAAEKLADRAEELYERGHDVDLESAGVLAQLSTAHALMAAAAAGIDAAELARRAEQRRPRAVLGG